MRNGSLHIDTLLLFAKTLDKGHTESAGRIASARICDRSSRGHLLAVFGQRLVDQVLLLPLPTVSFERFP